MVNTAPKGVNFTKEDLEVAEVTIKEEEASLKRLLKTKKENQSVHSSWNHKDVKKEKCAICIIQKINRNIHQAVEDFNSLLKGIFIKEELEMEVQEDMAVVKDQFFNKTVVADINPGDLQEELDILAVDLKDSLISNLLDLVTIMERKFVIMGLDVIKDLLANSFILIKW